MKRALQAGVGLAISAVALWLTLRGKDLGAIWDATREADYRYVVPYLAILLLVHLARTVRWGILLEPVATVPFARLNAASAVGFMALVLVPFRLGEFVRPYLVSEPGRLRVSTALSTIVVERVSDGMFTGLLLVVVLLAVPDGAPAVGILRVGGVLVSLAFLSALAFLVLASRNRTLAVRLAAGALRPFSPAFAERAAGMLDAFIHGLRLFPSVRKAAAFVGLTLVYWGLNAFGMKVLALGFGFDLGALEAATLLAVLVVGVMIPAGPGMVGTFQGAVVLALALFAPAEAVATRGTAYANVLWAVQLSQLTALGLFFLFSRHIQLGRLTTASAAIGAGLEAEEVEYRRGAAPP
jgi:glycosyltransferase 2 family protein